MTEPLAIVYFGTADFAVAPLERLVSDPRHFRVLAVVSQPDKPAGRAGEPKRPPVAQLAHQRHLKLLQPERIRGNAEFFATIAGLKPVFFVVAAYGKLLPAELLAIPQRGAVNLHGSLLPKYRGASPIQSALLSGDAVTGVTLMLMDAEMDHGPTFTRAEITIGRADTYGSLSQRLSAAAAALLADNLEAIAVGRLQPAEQDHAAATNTRIISKEDGLADWHLESAARLERKIRAYDPWPGVYATWRRGDKALRLKILAGQPIPEATGKRPGEAFVSAAGYAAVKAADGALELRRVQMEGRKPQDGREFLRGYQDFVGSIMETPAEP